MKVELLILTPLVGMVLLTGCRSPEFSYSAPPASLDHSGPSIVVLPLADGRSNSEADHVFGKKYLAQAQGAIVQELQSMRYFSSVIASTNQDNLPLADFQLSPTLQRLDWEIQHHGRVETEKAAGHTVNFVANLTLGLPVGDLFMLGEAPVCGNSALEVAVRRTADQTLLLSAVYSDTVTNRVKKSLCDKPQTKAMVMLAAFQNTEGELKSDLLKQLIQDKY